jgi:acetyl-CoA C-acetyltransferase
MGGSLREMPAAALAALVIQETVKRSGIDPSLVNDVILGNCSPSGEAPAIGRVAALDAGLPVTVGGLQLDRRCASGLEAVAYAVMLVESGAADVVIAGGAESMSNTEYYTQDLRPRVRSSVTLTDRLQRARVTAGGRDYPVPGGMLETAENLRRRYQISRQAQDELALRSHQRAVAAQETGRFNDEIVEVVVGDAVVSRDEHPRPDTSLEKLAALRPVLRRSDPEATVTAGNASGQNDGAAVCLVTTEERARELGAPFGLRMLGIGRSGVAPAEMGIGPVPATAAAFSRTGHTLADMDLIEVNEAFAAQTLAVFTEWGLTDQDWDRFNVNGSGISLGHPVGATGARILATLMHELARRGQGIALESICVGGGQGISAVFEFWS